MRKILALLLLIMASSITVHAQSRGVKIGYIDMEYILQNVPDYTEAKNQLEQKAQKWKQEIETKKNDVTRLKDNLATERVLLTKELIQEREEEISYQETQLLDYQQKRFGSTGDLSIQKAVLAQPVQDQVFNAVQDIAEAKKYDFIFDKTSDLTMLFSAKRYDISDQVIRVITRSTKRSQMSKKQLKAEEAKEAKEDMVDENPGLQERQKKLDERKAAREKLIADRKAATDEKKRLAAERKAGRGTKADAPSNSENTAKPSDSTAVKLPEISKAADSTASSRPKKPTAEERAKILADRKKAAEEKRQKAIADREAARKEKEEKAKQGK